MSYQVKKKIKGDDVFGLPVVKKTRHALSEVDPCLPDSLLAQHIGELLAYVDTSVTHMDLCGSVGRDILGFTVEKTLVRDIFQFLKLILKFLSCFTRSDFYLNR